MCAPRWRGDNRPGARPGDQRGSAPHLRMSGGQRCVTAAYVLLKGFDTRLCPWSGGSCAAGSGRWSWPPRREQFRALAASIGAPGFPEPSPWRCCSASDGAVARSGTRRTVGCSPETASGLGSPPSGRPSEGHLPPCMRKPGMWSCHGAGRSGGCVRELSRLHRPGGPGTTVLGAACGLTRGLDMAATTVTSGWNDRLHRARRYHPRTLETPGATSATGSLAGAQVHKATGPHAAMTCTTSPHRAAPTAPSGSHQRCRTARRSPVAVASPAATAEAVAGRQQVLP